MTNRIIDKIKKCLAVASCPGASEQEAATAMRQAQKLMEEHGIDDGDILAAETSEEAASAGAASKPARWESNLAGACARAFGCRVIFGASFHPRTGDWLFIGTGAAPKVSVYAFKVLFRQAKKARTLYIEQNLKRCKPKNRTARADMFCLGWVASATGKLAQLTLSEHQEASIAAFIERKHPRTEQFTPTNRQGKNLTTRNLNDFGQGHRNGEAAQLHNGVGAADGPRQISQQ